MSRRGLSVCPHTFRIRFSARSFARAPGGQEGAAAVQRSEPLIFFIFKGLQIPVNPLD